MTNFINYLLTIILISELVVIILHNTVEQIKKMRQGLLLKQYLIRKCAQIEKDFLIQNSLNSEILDFTWLHNKDKKRQILFLQGEKVLKWRQKRASKTAYLLGQLCRNPL